MKGKAQFSWVYYLYLCSILFFSSHDPISCKVNGKIKGVWYTIHGKCNTYIWELILPSDLRTLAKSMNKPMCWQQRRKHLTNLVYLPKSQTNCLKPWNYERTLTSFNANWQGPLKLSSSLRIVPPKRAQKS